MRVHLIDFIDNEIVVQYDGVSSLQEFADTIQLVLDDGSIHFEDRADYSSLMVCDEV